MGDIIGTATEYKEWLKIREMQPAGLELRNTERLDAPPQQTHTQATRLFSCTNEISHASPRTTPMLEMALAVQPAITSPTTHSLKYQNFRSRFRRNAEVRMLYLVRRYLPVTTRAYIKGPPLLRPLESQQSLKICFLLHKLLPQFTEIKL